MTKYTKQQFLGVCIGTTVPSWPEFISNLLFKWDPADTATETAPGHIKKETDTRSKERSVPSLDGHSRAVLSYQLPLLEAVVNGSSTSVGIKNNDNVQGRGLKITSIYKTLTGSLSRLNFSIENTMVLSSSDSSITITETPALSGNYNLVANTTVVHKLKLLVGGTADYLGNKLMGSLYVSADTIGVKHIDSSSIGFTTGGGGMTADIILDSTTLEITASGLRLKNASTYLLTTGDFAVAGLLTLTQLPVCAAVPAGNTALTNKLYVDTLDTANVKKTGNQTIDDVKTFSSFPVTPSAAPTLDYQVANKKYVDEKYYSTTFLYKEVEITHDQIITGFTVPVLVIDAPTGDYAIEVIKCNAETKNWTTPYATYTDATLLTDTANTEQHLMTQPLLASVNRLQKTEAVITISPTTTQLIKNKGLYFKVKNGDPTAGTTGQVLKLFITYQLIYVG